MEFGNTLLHASYPAGTPRPVIGITANFIKDKATLAEAYYQSVIAAGGTPLLIPPYNDREALFETLEHLDAIMLSGGADIDPRYMGEEPDYTLLHNINPKRDEQEIILTMLAENRGMPILGICRGIQIMTAALGGKLYQDIYKEAGATLKHSQDTERHVATHSIRIASSSKLASIFGTTNIHVNSFHHQAVKVVAPGFAATALSPDGLIEAVESIHSKSMIGVQWHPECMILGGDRTMIPLFEWLVGEAGSYARVRNLHQRVLTLDTHCDTPMKFDQQIRFDSRDPRILVDLHKMTEGRLDATIMVAYLRQQERDKASLDAAFAKADRLLTEIEAIVNSGTRLDIQYYLNTVMDEDKVEDIYLYFKEDAESDSLDAAIEELGSEYSEEEIRLVRIKFISEVAN